MMRSICGLEDLLSLTNGDRRSVVLLALGIGKIGVLGLGLSGEDNGSLIVAELVFLMHPHDGPE